MEDNDQHKQVDPYKFHTSQGATCFFRIKWRYNFLSFYGKIPGKLIRSKINLEKPYSCEVKSHATDRANCCLMGKHPPLSLVNKRLLYLMVICPTSTYATPMWCTANRSYINILEKPQNNIIRSVVNNYP